MSPSLWILTAFVILIGVEVSITTLWVCHKITQISKETIAACQRVEEGRRYALASYQEAIQEGQETAKADGILIGDAYQSYKTLADEAAQSYRILADSIIQSYKTMGGEYESITKAVAASYKESSDACQNSMKVVADICRQAVSQATLHAKGSNEPWASGTSFTCHYCHNRFPITELETIGKYDYCLEHGLARQQRMLEEEFRGH
jgi:hypothetical protein